MYGSFPNSQAGKCMEVIKMHKEKISTCPDVQMSTTLQVMTNGAYMPNSGVDLAVRVRELLINEKPYRTLISVHIIGLTLNACY